MEYYGVVFKGESLSHHGIKGMKWGVRRFQNPDGSLTPEGMKRYGIDPNGQIYRKGRQYKKTLAKAKEYGDALAKTVRIDREVSTAAKKAGVKEGDYIQFPPELYKEYKDAVDLVTKLSVEFNDKKIKGEEYIKTLEDGKDYVAIIMRMKHSKAYIEYYSLIGESERKNR